LKDVKNEYKTLRLLQKKTMPIKHQQGNIAIRQLEGLTRVEITAFVISIQAVHRKGNDITIAHHPLLAASHLSADEAEKAGMKEALRMWSKADGWEGHGVIVMPSSFTFDIATKPK
jgi:hypothetical protein